MPPTLELLGRDPITYESATNKDANIVNQLGYLAATQELYQQLWRQRDAIGAVTKHHLRLDDSAVCTVPPAREWLRGSFNVCIPVRVASRGSSRRVMMRCAMPHKLAEAQYAGTVNEKLRCEVATYAWMQDNCPDVRIPLLYGFGFTDHHHYTHEQQRPWYIRLARALQRHLRRLLGYPMLSHYTPNPTAHRLSTAYMLLEYISPDVGQMLSKTYPSQREDAARRQRLFRGLARVMLSLARIPQPRIGSFQFHDDCSVALTNRPLTCSVMILENDGAPRTMAVSDTYRGTESYVADMLTFHDGYFLSNPNAVYDDDDCRGQMAVKMLLRALSHNYIMKEQRHGPFLLQFTDFHASNVFVDDEWSVTCLVDLEWVCALPMEMLAVPYWLTGRGIDQIDGEHYDKFDQVRQEFMRIFEEEEHKMAAKHGLSLTKAMNQMWDSKGVWFWFCVGSVNAMLSVLGSHVCPRFSTRLTDDVDKVLSKFWCVDSARVVERKVADLSKYDQELRRLFGKDAPEAPCPTTQSAQRPDPKPEEGKEG